jgi:hypothetical protein
MAHQGLSDTARWIAIFYRAGGGHEPVVAAGTAQEATVSRVVHGRRGWRWPGGAPEAGADTISLPSGAEFPILLV